MYNLTDIANKIKSVAKARGIAIKDLLLECDLGINAISELSKGKQLSSISLAKIADHLKVSVDYLLGRTDTPSQWFCDVCGRVIESPNKGYVVWKYGNSYESEGYFKYKILHPRGLLDEYGERYGCDNDSSYCYSASLVDFVGDRGLAALLYILDSGLSYEFEYRERINNVGDFLELFRRIHMPYYEEARFYFKEAYMDGYFEGASQIWSYLPSTLKNNIEKYKNNN